ncbi:very short patch repair endonuclease [Burkholderia gladioli]|uniref:very short patch repair endonuclease n=1 Tax=Burkholderia gladioli TaxID=28095 RepID=UPI000D01017F|nr:very short patch repair endonuclease [Burkholderia gladioli]MBA1365421.1 DNA mismatch endonuclease Vsr [Burkholderia gladioli]PRG50545.1 very short patch repair endonuclease [Burkholderia gladioli]
MDKVSREVRSRVMQSIKGKNTKPELSVRSAMHRRGFRFRLHRRDLPGTPDIVLPRYRLAIFVHGCFWHRHAGCSRATMPSTNVEYWATKFSRNQERDRCVKEALHALGWAVFEIWECEANKPPQLAQLVDQLAARYLNDDHAIRSRPHGD